MPTTKYFAIGSMINPTSMSLRNLKPLSSKPAVLTDFSLKFMGVSGMAFAVPAAGEHIDGVVHTMTAEDMVALDKLEFSYDRHEGKAKLYDDSVISCTVYVQKASGPSELMGSGEHPPQERYVDIIVRGMREFGVKQAAIDRLLALEVQPRKTKDQFKRFTIPDGTPCWTKDEFEHQVKSGRLLDICNGVVTEVAGDRDKLPEVVLASLGADNTHRMSGLLYEPLYGLPSCLEEMSEEHRAWVEDLIVTGQERMPGMFKVSATISDYAPYLSTKESAVLQVFRKMDEEGSGKMPVAILKRVLTQIGSGLTEQELQGLLTKGGKEQVDKQIDYVSFVYYVSGKLPISRK